MAKRGIVPNAIPFDVAVCGSLHLDVVVQAPGLPRLDETAVGTRWSFKCGGKGGNQAVMAARLGARVAMMGRVGTDEFGRTLLSNLRDAGVDHGAVSVDEASGSGMSVAIVRPDGNYGAVIVSGANLAIDSSAVAASWEALGGARVLLLQNELPEAANVAMAEAARRAGATIVLNAAPARPLAERFLDSVDILVVNRVEAEFLFGREVRDLEEAAQVLDGAPPGRPGVVITLGGDGLAFQRKGQRARRLEPHRVEVVSSHGAGDCFLGALAARLARGDDLGDACEWANAAAALFVSRDGPGQASMAGRDVDEFVTRRGRLSAR
jgi:ribokinase